MVQWNLSLYRGSCDCRPHGSQYQLRLTFDSSVIVCAHNEERYIEGCLRSIVAQRVVPSQVIVVLDRCTDKTKDIAMGVLSGRGLLIEKDVQRWKHTISENLEMARARATGQALAIIDADITVPSNFLEQLLPQLKEYSSVSAVAKTDPSQGLLNRAVSAWEYTYRFAPFGKEPRGGARVILARDLAEVGGFHDVTSWDTDIDNRLRKSGHKVRLDASLSALHRRKMNLRRSLSYQIEMGKARRELGLSPSRSILHSIFRLRPFVIFGYVTGRKSGESSTKT